jgi:hypothetical protein
LTVLEKRKSLDPSQEIVTIIKYELAFPGFICLSDVAIHELIQWDRLNVFDKLLTKGPKKSVR